MEAKLMEDTTTLILHMVGANPNISVFDCFSTYIFFYKCTGKAWQFSASGGGTGIAPFFQQMMMVMTEITQPCVHTRDGLFICQLYLLPELL
jgi:hypothetical protein